MKFPYIKFPSSDPKQKWVSRPYIPLKIIGQKGIWEGYGLIDSGADKSLLNTEIAEEIGFDLNESQCENFSGIEGGKLKARVARIRLQIAGFEEIKIAVGFVNSAAVGVILGQEGFFDEYRIKFERDHGIFEITPIRR
ncbi:retroviral-like aspartic protease family protein [Patescibacteria group bacterium]|nr:retroviral-like aspartic protease family protein [Patescibacteria group bacterium]